MRLLRLALLIAAAAALVTPTALAASATGDLTAEALRAPEARVESAGLDLAVLDGATPTLDLTAREVVVQRIGSSQLRSGSLLEHNANRIDERGSFDAARLTLSPGDGEALVALRTSGPASADVRDLDARALGGVLLAAIGLAAEEGGDPTTDARCLDDTCLDAFGVYGLSGASAATVSGDLVLLLYGPTLHVLAADGTERAFQSGVTSTRETGPVTQTDDAWVYVRAKAAVGTVDAERATLYSAAPTIRAGSVTLTDAAGLVRVGAREYRASGVDVAAAGAIVLTPAAVPPASYHGTPGEPVAARTFTTRVAGDVQSIDLAGRLSFLDEPAEQAGAAALLAILAAAVAYTWQHLAFGAAALYTRLNKPEILENDVRNAIYEIIRQNPGISAREVHRRSEQSWGTVVYHLRQLERHHLVVSRAIGRTRNYYENHGKYKGMEAQLACLQSDRARLLARAILKQPGITQEQLAVAAQLPQPTTSYYVRKLKQANLVDEQRDGRYVKYVPHADLARFVELSESSVQTGGNTGAGVQA